jgi:hypothetical protein
VKWLVERVDHDASMIEINGLWLDAPPNISSKSMPVVKRVIDAQWNYLRPSLHILKLPDFRVACRPTSWAFKRCLNIQRHNNMRISTTKPRASLHCNAPGNSIYARKYLHQNAVFSELQRRDQGFMRELAIETAYQKLRQIALEGNYSQIQACVNIMLTVRDEKPNARLYDALLLANMDNEYGSASEISNLLEEMVNGGITQNSATYHAVLRVKFTCSYIASGATDRF